MRCPLAPVTRLRSAALSSIGGSMRWRELRFGNPTVGWTASIGPGAARCVRNEGAGLPVTSFSAVGFGCRPRISRSPAGGRYEPYLVGDHASFDTEFLIVPG